MHVILCFVVFWARDFTLTVPLSLLRCANESPAISMLGKISVEILRWSLYATEIGVVCRFNFTALKTIVADHH